MIPNKMLLALCLVSTMLVPSLNLKTDTGAILSVWVQGMTPGKYVELINLSSTPPKIITSGTADAMGRIYFKHIYIRYLETEPWYEDRGHYVTFRAADGLDKFAIASIRID